MLPLTVCMLRRWLCQLDGYTFQFVLIEREMGHFHSHSMPFTNPLQVQFNSIQFNPFALNHPLNPEGSISFWQQWLIRPTLATIEHVVTYVTC